MKKWTMTLAFLLVGTWSVAVLADDPQPERVGQGLQQLRLLLIEGGGIAHVAHLIVIF